MKTAIFLLNIFLLGNSHLSAQIPDSLKYLSLNPKEFQLQSTNTDSAIIIDVREPFEFKGNRIKGAVNIPSSGSLERAADTLNKHYTFFLYCTSGHRSSRVAISLYDKGFRKLVSLKGGIVDWRKEGMPVSRGRIKRRK
jgi:rhodanese-related sulfurtransferase